VFCGIVRGRGDRRAAAASHRNVGFSPKFLLTRSHFFVPRGGSLGSMVSPRGMREGVSPQKAKDRARAWMPTKGCDGWRGLARANACNVTESVQASRRQHAVYLTQPSRPYSRTRRKYMTSFRSVSKGSQSPGNARGHSHLDLGSSVACLSFIVMNNDVPAGFKCANIRGC
jgi:hypothetical protein